MSSHDSSSDIDDVELTPEQAQALGTLLELTEGADIEVAKGVLASVDWNVERAAELVFGQNPVNMSAREPTVTQRQSTFQTFDVDDSAQGQADETEGLLRRSNAPERPQSNGSTILRPIFSIISVPFNIIFNLFRIIFSVLRIPFPFSSSLGPLRFSSLNFYRPLSGTGNSGQRRRRGPDAWIRELEEETGAVSIALEGGNKPRASGVSLDPAQSSISSRSGPGPSSQAAGSSGAGGSDDAPTKYLPDFVICTYEEMLRRCQSEFKIGCVILVSEEHDDVPEFKRSTLTDYPFVKALRDNNILVWGGDVRDREAWGAAEKLQATTYPFVAFVALQPRRSPSSSSSMSSSNTQLTVLSRHQGSARPYSAASSPGPTSATALLAHLENQLLPRVSPFLNRMIHAQEQRAYDRRMREQQDRAYEETARRDKERILKSMEDARLKKEKEERERLEEERKKKEEEERIRKEKEEKETRERVRGDVRSWIAKHIVPGASKPEGGKVSRFAIRLPDGSRALHTLSDETSLTGLFSIVDVAIGGKNASDDTTTAVDGLPADGNDAESKLEAYILRVPSESVEQSFWHFRLATAYPRVEILWKAETKLKDIEALKGGGQIVAEKISVFHKGNGKAKADGDDDDDDGYRTEDSE